MYFFSSKTHHFSHSDRNSETHDSPFYALGLPINPEGSGVPTAMFHGYGESCTDQKVIKFDDMVAAGLNANVHCIDIGATRYAEEFNNFKTIAEKSC